MEGFYKGNEVYMNLYVCALRRLKKKFLKRIVVSAFSILNDAIYRKQNLICKRIFDYAFVMKRLNLIINFFKYLMHSVQMSRETHERSFDMKAFTSLKN